MNCLRTSTEMKAMDDDARAKKSESAPVLLLNSFPSL